MKLLEQGRDVIRKKHYSIRTEQAAVGWIRRFIMFHKEQHPKDMGEKEISQFISHLATDKNVAASTQNQALNAIVFLYKQVLNVDLGDFGHMERARKPEKLPTVMSRDEAGRILASMTGIHQLMAKLLYGCGLRLMECVCMRVKDIDFEQNHIIVRDGKGMKDRSTMLPEQLKPLLLKQRERVRITHEQDLKKGDGVDTIVRAVKVEALNSCSA